MQIIIECKLFLHNFILFNRRIYILKKKKKECAIWKIWRELEDMLYIVVVMRCLVWYLIITLIQLYHKHELIFYWRKKLYSILNFNKNIFKKKIKYKNFTFLIVDLK